MLYDFAFYELCRPKIEKKHALKVSGLGTTDFRTTKACDIITIAWYDNRRVTLTSAYLSIKPVKLKPRWDRKQHKRAMVKSQPQESQLDEGYIPLGHCHGSDKRMATLLKNCELFSGQNSDSMNLLAFMTSITESLCFISKALKLQRGRRTEGTVEEVAEPSTSTGTRSMPPVVEDAQQDKVVRCPDVE
ncbi:hypothetical protein T4B_5572 [Trichinella pseudospiralis]|uniref:PiggyBac transposable element-derived protein domain-containing protein n=1 Tax=Trichinella pseudospiralis TaxID=6337 RepID=A0A0V1IU22_TRIPS|nr:hypothetical protein T4A_12158 [Trichinella pseudospiralis]KRZ15269.1 hypothetical protein T4B_5572 [Trichinella pseudospiralis]KRZ26282.1 hypothetical protein T4C_2304 [Trichinella pseudospiralis]